MSTYVIADIGANHDGDPTRMARAIAAAKQAGADQIKFQWTSDPDAMAARRGRATEDGYADVYRKYLAWPADLHARLSNACLALGIDYGCTVFLPHDVNVVAPYVRHFKVASFEAEDRALLSAYRPVLEEDRAAGRGRWLIVSLGMGAAKPHQASFFPADIDDRSYVAMSAVRTLRCVSAYPAPPEALQLRRMLWPYYYDSSWQVMRSQCDGLSDHTQPWLTWTGALAVAAGASIVEAHLRLLDTDLSNPDYSHAMSPVQFEEYVQNIRFAERCLGDGVWGMHPCEAEMAKYRVGAPESHQVEGSSR